MPNSLTNAQIAATFRLLADLLAIRGESVYKVTAYRRAAESIAQTSEPIAAIRQRGRLTDIPGVGKEIARKLTDLLDTGTFRLLEDVETEFPPGVATLLTVPEIGPKRARLLYQQLGIESLDALRGAIIQGRLARVPGLGPREVARIAAGLESLQVDERRLPIGVARPMGIDLISHLRDHIPAIRQIELVGSIRRCLETIGDLDIVAAAPDPPAVVAAFVTLPPISRVESRGQNRCRVVLESGFGADLWVLPERHWGSLLQHTTGSKYHDIHLRDLALARGTRMSEYGFATGETQIPRATEEDVYAFFGMQYIPPPMREDTGEIELALQHRLPRVVVPGDVRGDLHTHSTWSDGTATIRELAEAARKRGYEYVCVADHSQGPAVSHGMTPQLLRAQRVEIDAINAELAPFRVLQGVEVEVRGDGSLDMPDAALNELDLVIAAMHAGLHEDRTTLMRRARAALHHPLVDILAHPTGRIIGERPGGDFDFEILFSEAARTGTALEINGDPRRLDLRDSHARAAVSAGCTLMLSSGAHSADDLANMHYSTGIAQRAWTPPEHVVNTYPLAPLQGRLKHYRQAARGE